MSLVERVLDGVSDVRLLSDHRQGSTPSPLQQLIADYSELSAHNDNAPNLTELSTGADLKTGIQKLDIEQQVKLLYRYLVNAKRLNDESPAELEDRKMRHWSIKFAMWCFAFVVVMLLGAVTAIAVRTGAAPSNELVSTFLDTASGVVRLLFSSGHSGG